MTIKQKIRFMLRGSISISSYGIAIIFLFSKHELLPSLTAVLVFFIAFHFFYIEIYKLKRRYVGISLVLGVLITGIIMEPQTITMWIANIGFHTTIGLLAYNLYRKAEGGVSFDGLTYFSSGGYLFTMALSLVYSTVIVNFFSEFPMTCGQLNEESEKVITTVGKPFKLSLEKTKQITQSSKTFFSSTFKDITTQTEKIEITSKDGENSFVKKLTTRKDNLITNTIQENSKLNNTICDYTLKIINEKLKSPTIQYPVIVLILFLIYPFLRIVIYVLSFVGLALFEVLYLFKFYRKHKETREVERIG